MMFRCYVYFNEPQIFLEAESQCRSIGGHLAVIRNGFENSYVAGVASMVSNGTASTYWIGASLLLSTKWSWTTDEVVTYSNWSPDEPQDPSSVQCARVRDDNFLWKKELCNAIHPFVCTIVPSNTPPAPTSNPSPCDTGYTLYEDQCFRLFNAFITPFDYDDSNQFCRYNENASLPKITSMGMQNFIESLIYGKDSIWLGMICSGSLSLDDCYWPDFSKPLGYHHFASGEPCCKDPVFMRSDDGLWRSGFPQSSRSIVVCQKPARAVISDKL